jgi:hypothetical protein
MSQLWTWFGNTFYPVLESLFRGLVSVLSRLFGPTFVILMKLAGVAWAMLEGLVWAVSTISDGIQEITVSGILKPDSSILVYGAFMNRFLPLTESFAMIAVLASLWSVVIAVRWIKSFIPTLSN